MAAPRRMSGGTLTLAVGGPAAMELQHLAPQLIARINTALGSRAGGAAALRAARSPAAGTCPGGATRSPEPAPVAVALPDGPLHDALARLGGRIAAPIRQTLDPQRGARVRCRSADACFSPRPRFCSGPASARPRGARPAGRPAHGGTLVRQAGRPAGGAGMVLAHLHPLRPLLRHGVSRGAGQADRHRPHPLRVPRLPPRPAGAGRRRACRGRCRRTATCRSSRPCSPPRTRGRSVRTRTRWRPSPARRRWPGFPRAVAGDAGR